MKYEKFFEEQLDLVGDDHLSSSADTPLREDAFEMTDEEKISVIEKNVHNILETLEWTLLTIA
mgnify:CR=1 FL=1